MEISLLPITYIDTEAPLKKLDFRPRAQGLKILVPRVRFALPAPRFLSFIFNKINTSNERIHLGMIPAYACDMPLKLRAYCTKIALVLVCKNICGGFVKSSRKTEVAWPPAESITRRALVGRRSAQIPYRSSNVEMTRYP